MRNKLEAYRQRSVFIAKQKILTAASSQRGNNKKGMEIKNEKLVKPREKYEKCST